MDKVDAQITDFIKKNELFSDCTGAVAAVSGGSDSMTVLMYLISNREKLGFPFCVAHVDHSLRPESTEEAVFVRDFCEKHHIPCEILKADIAADKPNGVSCEEYARNVRYDFFYKIREKYGYSHIITAHNKNDATETFFLNLIRGMGASGAAGIPAKRSDGIVRPLLSCEKEDILAHCRENRIPFVTDRSNFESVYTRNILRNEILPLLKKINPSLDDAVGRYSASVSEDEYYLRKCAEKALENLEKEYGENRQKNELPLNFLCNLEKPIKSRVLRSVFSEITDGLVLTYKQTNDIISLLEKCSVPDRVQLSGGFFVKIGYHSLFFTKCEMPETFCVSAELGNTLIGNRTITLSQTIADGTNFKNRFVSDLPITFRSRRAGDRIKLPKRPEKSVRELFIDEKIPAEKRSSILIAVDKNDRPIWIQGFGPDEKNIPEKNGQTIEVKIIMGENFNG